MTEAEARLRRLSPAQRAALARRLRDRPAATPPAAGDFALDDVFASDEQAVKNGYRRFYDAVSTQLDADIYGAASFFLNYGYLSDGSPERAVVQPPEQYLNRTSVKLVLELIADCPVEGRDVLDVGCGRGGTAHVLKTFFAPASVTGLDLAPAAIAFCRRTHGGASTRFLVGDSENLPFEAASFDVVTNVESSHSYPNVAAFYREVARVLRPGGDFLYTDALSGAQFETARGLLSHLGLVLLRDDDVTANVLLSCDAVATARVGAFDSANDPTLMGNFLATPGSQVYRDLQSGTWSYRIMRMRKSHGSGSWPISPS